MSSICVEYGPAACLAWNKIKVHFCNTLSCITIFHICYISGEELTKTTDRRPHTINASFTDVCVIEHVSADTV